MKLREPEAAAKSSSNDETMSTAKTVHELFGDKPSSEFDPDVENSYLKAKFEKEIEISLKLSQKEKEMGIKERQSMINTNSAVTGMMVVWTLIGVVMLGKSCINTDPGPKFKV